MHKTAAAAPGVTTQVTPAPSVAGLHRGITRSRVRPACTVGGIGAGRSQQRTTVEWSRVCTVESCAAADAEVVRIPAVPARRCAPFAATVVGTWCRALHHGLLFGVERVHGAHQNFERIARKRFLTFVRQSQTDAPPIRLGSLSD